MKAPLIQKEAASLCKAIGANPVNTKRRRVEVSSILLNLPIREEEWDRFLAIGVGRFQAKGVVRFRELCLSMHRTRGGHQLMQLPCRKRAIRIIRNLSSF